MRKHEQFIYKLQKTNAGSVSEAVAEKHFETLKQITKAFTDRNNEHFA